MTEYKSAKEAILKTYSLEELKDIVEHGCASGKATQHVYYSETIQFFDDYEDEITEYIKNEIGSQVLTETFDENEGVLNGYKNDIAWTFIELIATEKVEEEEGESNTPVKEKEFSSEVYKNSGKYKYKNGDIKGAIKDFDKAIEIEPDYVNAYFNRGVARYASEDLKGACEDWKKAAELGEEDAAKLVEEHCE